MEEQNNTQAPETTLATPAKTNFAVPIAIVIAGFAIATAVYFGDSKKITPPEEEQNVVLSAVTADDHMLGNPRAKVVIVEYSDTECPFCKMFHDTMNKVMGEYGEGGNVAWVYRHYPLPFHQKAPKEAEATECANKLGGVEKFWAYTNTVFRTTQGNDSLNEAELPKIAEEIGLDKTAFMNCLSSGEMKARVDRDLESGRTAGVNGTPHSLVLVNGKVAGTIKGAQPYEQVKAIIEAALK
jgi:protein-disulfide isomerase